MPTNLVSAALGPLARLFALIAGYAVLGLALLITAEVLLRKLFNVSLQGSAEFGGYTLATLAAFGFAPTICFTGLPPENRIIVGTDMTW